ncbi:GNAT family N-acetyltransferase [Streptomyces sp. HSW2009]|uniref:GNAT family N-acetyltransferase n=1 Tax=Streptomyces sp. HSW2009 TaxID=3142890 RepID=UPI0032EBCC4C
MEHSEPRPAPAEPPHDPNAPHAAGAPGTAPAPAAPGAAGDDPAYRARLRAQFDRQLREKAPADGPASRVEQISGVVRQTSTENGWNGVLWSQLDAATADAAIAEQIRHFGALGRSFEWKLYDYDEPADLADRLRAAGFVPEPAEALLVADVQRQPTEVRLPDGVTLRPVRDAADVRLMAEVHQQAFGTDASAFHARLAEQITAGSDTLVATVVMAGDEPVCAARMEFYPGTEFVGLWGGGTAPAWRGRGIYRALVAHRARIAAERGYRYLQVDASDDSRPILQRLGFVHLATTTPYVYGA